LSQEETQRVCKFVCFVPWYEKSFFIHDKLSLSLSPSLFFFSLYIRHKGARVKTTRILKKMPRGGKEGPIKCVKESFVCYMAVFGSGYVQICHNSRSGQNQTLIRPDSVATSDT